MGELLRPDIAGDSVRVDSSFSRSVFAPPWWFYPAAVLFGAWFGLSFPNPSGNTGFRVEAALIAIGIALALLLMLELAAWAERGVHRGMVRGSRCETAAEAARQALTRGRASSRRGIFDTEWWIAETGPAGPRLILCACDVRPFDTPGDLAEPVDMAAGRKTSRMERSMFWVIFGASLLACGTLALAALRSGSAWGLAGVGPIVWLGYAVWAAGRLGFRPVSLTAAVATPGRIEFTRFGRDTVFTREDSVLLLYGQSMGWSAAVFVRRDGARCAIGFGPGDAGEGHPALVDLLARWCCRDARPAE